MRRSLETCIADRDVVVIIVNILVVIIIAFPFLVIVERYKVISRTEYFTRRNRARALINHQSDCVLPS